eukprot:SAG31_NODE_12189_length_960_cov_1.221835_1_plen_53_part_10
MQARRETLAQREASRLADLKSTQQELEAAVAVAEAVPEQLESTDDIHAEFPSF